MTRLVGVKAVCDVCSAARATVFCVTHRHVSCASCDAVTHPSPGCHHQRVDLDGAVTALPFCDKCDNAPATWYCESEGLTLCGRCDVIVHVNKSCAAHHRRLISKALAQRTVSFIGAPAPQSVTTPTSALLSSPPTSSPVVTTSALTSKGSPTSRSRRKSASSPMKRRHRRPSPIKASTDERPRPSPPRMLAPAPPRIAPSTSQPIPYRDPSTASPRVVSPAPIACAINPVNINPENALAYMQAMSNMLANPGQLDYYNAAVAASVSAMPSSRITDHPQFFSSSPNPQLTALAQQHQFQQQSQQQRSSEMLIPDRPAPVQLQQQQRYTNIAPHPGAPLLAPRPPSFQQPQHHLMDPNHSADVAAAAAAAATAAGEMYLLSASDAHGSGASPQALPPPFASFAVGAADVSDSGVRPGLAAGVTAAATNAADAYLVEQARCGRPPPAPPPVMAQTTEAGHDATTNLTGSTSLLGSVAPDDTFHFTDLDDITRGDGGDDFAVFGNLDLSSFEPIDNAKNETVPQDSIDGTVWRNEDGDKS